MLIYIFLKVGNKKDSTSKTKKKTDELVFINIKYFLNQKTSKINLKDKGQTEGKYLQYVQQKKEL